MSFLWSISNTGSVFRYVLYIVTVGNPFKAGPKSQLLIGAEGNEKNSQVSL